MSTAFILASTSQEKNLLELVGVLIIFVFVLLITYLTTKWMGGFQKAKFKNRNMQILETISIGNNKTLSIVSVGKRYFVVAVGKDNVQLISEIQEEDFTDCSFLSEPEHAGTSFQDILSKIRDKGLKK